jgi:DNA repair exonuclease SbcCD ATPase subunit
MSDHLEELLESHLGEIKNAIKDLKRWRSGSQVATKQDLIEIEKRMAKTQQELVVEMQTLNSQITKIGAETTSLLQKITELQALIDAGGNTLTPETQAAWEAVKASAQGVDDEVPDAPPTP